MDNAKSTNYDNDSDDSVICDGNSSIVHLDISLSSKIKKNKRPKRERSKKDSSLLQKSKRLSLLDSLFPGFFYGIKNKVDEIFNCIEAVETHEQSSNSGKMLFKEELPNWPSNLISQAQCEELYGQLRSLEDIIKNLKKDSIKNLSKYKKQKQIKRLLRLNLEQAEKEKNEIKAELQKLRELFKKLPSCSGYSGIDKLELVESSSEGISSVVETESSCETFETSDVNVNSSSDNVNDSVEKEIDPLQLNSSSKKYQIFCEEVEIPENMMGPVIGQYCENLKKIQIECGCNISLPNEGKGEVGNILTLTGSLSANKKAKEKLNDIICKKKALYDSSYIPSGHILYKKRIYRHEIGKIIGCSGQTIKKIELKCGVLMGFDSRDLHSRKKEIFLRIVGPVKKCHSAVSMVDKILNRHQCAFSQSKIKKVAINENDKKIVAALNRYQGFKLNSKSPQVKKHSVDNIMQSSTSTLKDITASPVIMSKTPAQNKKQKKTTLQHIGKHLESKSGKGEKSIDEYTRELTDYLQNRTQDVLLSTENISSSLDLAFNAATDCDSMEKNDISVEAILPCKNKQPLATITISDNETENE